MTAKSDVGTISIGPCECGGYGQALDEESRAMMAACHLDLEWRHEQVIRCELVTDIRLERNAKGEYRATLTDGGKDIAGCSFVDAVSSVAVGRAMERIRERGLLRVTEAKARQEGA